jgi:hypothetical protein
MFLSDTTEHVPPHSFTSECEQTEFLEYQMMFKVQEPYNPQLDILNTQKFLSCDGKIWRVVLLMQVRFHVGACGTFIMSLTYPGYRNSLSFLHS